jgi:hypothetical protein
LTSPDFVVNFLVGLIHLVVAHNLPFLSEALAIMELGPQGASLFTGPSPGASVSTRRATPGKIQPVDGGGWRRGLPLASRFYSGGSFPENLWKKAESVNSQEHSNPKSRAAKHL